MMSSVDISQYARKGKSVAQPRNRGYIPDAERVETFCYYNSKLPIDSGYVLISYMIWEQIDPLQQRLTDVSRMVWDDYNGDYSTVGKEGFDEQLVTCVT